MQLNLPLQKKTVFLLSMVIQVWMTFTQNQFFIYTRKVFVSLEFNFCLSKLFLTFIL